MRMPVMNSFGLYNEIRKLDNKVKICFLTAAEDTYYETFRKQAHPNYDENCILRKPIENELEATAVGPLGTAPANKAIDDRTAACPTSRDSSRCVHAGEEPIHSPRLLRVETSCALEAEPEWTRRRCQVQLHLEQPLTAC